MGNFNKNKFVFWETFTNKDGKTSGSGFIGVILGLIVGISMLATMISHFLRIPGTVEIIRALVESMLYVAILLGVRKASSMLLRKGSVEEWNDNSNPYNPNPNSYNPYNPNPYNPYNPNPHNHTSNIPEYDPSIFINEP